MGPCEPLITGDDIAGSCCCDDAVGAPPEVLDRAAGFASHVAWHLSGRRLGVCALEGERPGRQNRRDCCLRVGCGCACRPASIVTLGRSPVISVDDVRVGGVSLDPAAYELIDNGQLVRRDGQRWPACQLLQDPDDADDVVVVDYTYGRALTDEDVAAVAAYACEVARGCIGVECALPSTVTQVVRQGVTFALIDPFEFLDQGRTGVYEFDLWLGTVNPYGLRDESTVWSPDRLEPIGGRRAGT